MKESIFLHDYALNNIVLMSKECLYATLQAAFAGSSSTTASSWAQQNFLRWVTEGKECSLGVWTSLMTGFMVSANIEDEEEDLSSNSSSWLLISSTSISSSGCAQKKEET